MKVERPRYGHVRFDVLESGFLKCPIWRHVKGVRFAEELFEFEDLEIDVDAFADASGTVALAPLRNIDDVEMHVRPLAEYDAIGRGEADRPIPLKPDDQQVGTALDRQGKLSRDVLPPRRSLRQPGRVHSQAVEVLGRRSVEIVRNQIGLVGGH